MKSLKEKWIRQQLNERLYQMPVPIIGLTGGIATGKSSVSKILIENGIKIIDADALVKGIYRSNDVLNEIKQIAPTAFNGEILDFKKLRELFFSNKELQKNIETIIYRRMPDAFRFAYENDVKDKQNFIVYDVPLLFEKDLAPKVDVKVCVWCSREMQIERLIKRDGINRDLAEKILERQWPIEKKKEASDLLIDNSESLTSLKNNVNDLLANLLL